MKQFILIGAILILLNSNVKGQSIINYDSTGIQLQKLATRIQEDTILRNRLNADSIFTRALVQNLKSPYSFKYNFDSLTAIKHISSPDGRLNFLVGRWTWVMAPIVKEALCNYLPMMDNLNYYHSLTIQILFKIIHWG